MTVRLYNFLTRSKEVFKPLKPGVVGLYTCGPTVYDYAHIGNLRTFVFEDILRRAFEFSGYRVRQVMNLTDVDDKTIKGAKEAGKSLKAFTAFYAKAFFRDAAKLNIQKAWKYPRATAHVKDMVQLIELLLKKKLAYQTNDGVYFDISRFKAYGKLSRLKQRELKTGARVAVDEYAKNQAEDFALWKKAKPSEPSWPASFGAGRPGWHIECSAMSMKYLGETFDIHTGGVDNIFPHHENEIAQSVGATGKPFARFFVEGEHLLVDGKKMAKSLGNFYTLADLEKKEFSPLDFRYLTLSAHYRSPLNFTWRSLGAAREARRSIMNTLARLAHGLYAGSLKDENEVLKVVASAEKRFREAIGDDLDMPRALAILSGLMHYANGMLDQKIMTRRAAVVIRATVFEFDRVFGLNLKKREVVVVPREVRRLMNEREALRKAKNWQAADRIRNKIRELGFEVEDTSVKPILKKK